MHQNTAPFQLLDASAGSGKTFSLVTDFLALCLVPGAKFNFRRILAVTFTNKAAAEMKSRVLETLQELSLGKPSGQLPLLMAATGQTEDELRKSATAVLEAMLHDYSNLNISTIDRFTHRLIRTFAQDLKLSQTFEVEMDTDSVLQQAVERVLQRVGEDPDLTEVLLDFLSGQLEESDQWNPERNLIDAAQNLKNEASIGPLEKVRDYTLQDFWKARQQSRESVLAIRKKMNQAGRDLLALMKEHNLDHADFHYKKAGPSGQFEKWANGRKYEELEPGARLRNAVTDTEKDQWFGKNDQYYHLSPQFTQMAGEALEFWDENKNRFLWESILEKELFSLALLNEINLAFKELKEEHNLLPISDFNRLVNQQIKDQHAPFIYERLGEKYRHYFIDEFQDTSNLQWHNLLPLVVNALSQGGTCLLVGDAKQSIYRWRNGNPEQFIEISKWPGDPERPVPVEAKTKRLADNWRSLQTIVDFNNGFFTDASAQLSQPDYQALYENAAQNAKRPAGGYVHLQFFDHHPVKENAMEMAVDRVKKLREAGYPAGDIAILVRTKSEGSIIAGLLAAENISVEGSDTLFVSNARQVNLIYAFMRWLYDQNNPQRQYRVLQGLVENHLVAGVENPAQAHHFYAGFRFPDFAFAEKLTGWLGDLQVKELLGYTLSELVENLCRVWGFWEDTNPFTLGFVEKVLAYDQNKGLGPMAFFDYWEKYGEQQAISASETQTAVQVMTMHKVKGLQFKIVIMPLINWPVRRPPKSEWAATPEGHSVPVVRTGLKSSLSGADPVLDQLYEEASQKEEFDDLNLLYVGFTRAVEQLYGFIPFKEKKNGPELDKSVARFFEKQLAQSNGQKVYAQGEMPPVPEKKEVQLPSNPKFYSSNWRHRVEISRTAPENWDAASENQQRFWGSLVHQILEKITLPGDAEPAIAQFVQEGRLTADEAERAHQLIDNLINAPELAMLWHDTQRVLNERDIIAANGQIRRADRIVKTKDGTWLIADYKTGLPAESHERQLENYARLFEEAYGQHSQKMLIYLTGDDVEVRRW